jgi:hypothetical protein
MYLETVDETQAQSIFKRLIEKVANAETPTEGTTI